MTPRGVPTRRAPPSSPLGTRSARTFVTKAAGTKPEHVLSAGSATFPPVTSTTSHPWWTDKRGPVTLSSAGVAKLANAPSCLSARPYSVALRKAVLLWSLRVRVPAAGTTTTAGLMPAVRSLSSSVRRFVFVLV
jgi:hypothetical protein